MSLTNWKYWSGWFSLTIIAYIIHFTVGLHSIWNQSYVAGDLYPVSPEQFIYLEPLCKVNSLELIIITLLFSWFQWILISTSCYNIYYFAIEHHPRTKYEKYNRSFIVSRKRYPIPILSLLHQSNFYDQIALVLITHSCIRLSTHLSNRLFSHSFIHSIISSSLFHFYISPVAIRTTGIYLDKYS